MTTQEIYSLSKEFTEKEINNVINAWENSGEYEQINRFNTLVSLGDSRGLALATTISAKYDSTESFDSYYKAYSI